ncbi:MAG: hypothetical protein HKO59_04925 [Phycisphaerales bacterium]|nr:hypothetical protein [Phycisphaerae bacterium]NNF43475.1 hypothetical protein [Phycisphaerales bacterium]NNM25318.1 hypothetical protein [Phycisphaerales bacterium]
MAPLVLPRALIFLASLWLIGSWLIAIGPMHPVHPSSASYEHGLRIMLLSLTTGVMIGWPLLRLSQTSSSAPIRQTILDVVVMLAMLQVVLWPLRLLTTWSLSRTAAIDASLTGWLLLAAAIVAAATGTPRPGPRALAMGACVGMCLLGPMLACIGLLTGGLSMSLIELSPLMAVRTLGDGGAAPVGATQWQWIVLLFGAVGATWVALLATSVIVRADPAVATR